MFLYIYRDVQRFEQSSSSKHPSSTSELAHARQQAIDVLKLSCSDRLAKLCVVILSDDDDDGSPPARKRRRHVSPRLPLSAISEEDEDIGHVEVWLLCLLLYCTAYNVSCM